MNTSRTYRSALREEQARQTRERILDGLLRAMAESGAEDFTIPAVARVAGVSTPTVYRHFHTKRELTLGLATRALQQAGLQFVPLDGPEQLGQTVHMIVEAYLADERLLRAVVMSEQSAELRAEVVPLRLELFDTALAALARTIPVEAYRRLRASLLLLTTGATVAACKDLLGLDGVQAADTITWALQSLIAAATTGGTAPADAGPPGAATTTTTATTTQPVTANGGVSAQGSAN